MPTRILAHEQPISRIFSNDYVFRIPGYQRPYAWTIEQARDLFDDVSSFIEDAHTDVVEEIPPYFLGSIVLIKSENLPDADVVDGQQRLTTITILLAAIRETADQENANNLSQLIHERGNQILGTQDRFRLSLRDRDQEFFQRYVQRSGTLRELVALDGALSDSQKNIRDNARHFLDRLESMTQADRLELAKFVVTRCFLVVVTTPDLDSAYRIFSVLNSRGLDLSATDILKAEVVGAITPNQRETYTHKWEDAEEDLGREPFGDLFSHIRMIYRKAKPKSTLLREFKDHVLEGVRPTDFIDEILIPYTDLYEQLTDAAYQSTENAEVVNVLLGWLNRFDFTDWMPPALAFAIRWKSDSARMARFFGDLERLAFWMLCTRSGINERIDRFSNITSAIEGGQDLSVDGSPLQLSPVEQYEMYNVLDGPVYESLFARSRSMILLRLDALMSGGGANYEYPIITVEHVLPQNPGLDSEWNTWFAGADERALWVHRLGNLALLTRKKNSSASNYEFRQKKDAYFSRNGVSPFVLTTQVLQHDQWTPAVVEARHRELLARLAAHWRLQGRRNPLELLQQDLTA